MRRQCSLLDPRGEAAGDAALDAAPLAPGQCADQRDVLGARPHERLADGQVRADVALLVRGAMRRAVCPEPASLAERAGVALVRLHLLATGGIHGREVR